MRRARGDEKAIAAADERLEKDLMRFEKNREECRHAMQGKTF